MIFVTVKKKKFFDLDIIFYIQTKNHSGLDKSGRDIVCAAVSTLTEFTANTLTEYFDVNCTIKSDEKIPLVSIDLTGYFTEIKVPDEKLLYASKLLESYADQIGYLSELYPKHIKLVLQQ